MHRIKLAALFIAILLGMILLSYGTQAAEQTLPERLAGRSRPPDEPLVPVAGADWSAAISASDATEGAADWGYLLLESYRDGNWEVYRANMDGSNMLNLTQQPADDYHPNVLPNAAQVVFTSERDGNPEIYTMNIDGSGLRRLTNNTYEDYTPAWRPDGSQIVYVSESDGNPEIYRINADGSGRTRLTTNSRPDISPAYSPDGTRLAYIKYFDSYYANITIKNQDGSETVLLPGGILLPGALAWSPDGKMIIVDITRNEDGSTHIIGVDVNTKLENFYYDPGGVTATQALDAWVGAFVPTGDEIMYVLADWRSDDGGNNYYLYQTWLEKVDYPNGDFVARLAINGVEAYPSMAKKDFLPPITRIAPLPLFSPAKSFVLYWQGADQGVAGIKDYGFEMRTDAYPMFLDVWCDMCTEPAFYPYTQPVLSGTPGTKYYFRIRGRDWAYNVEDWPPGLEGDVSTTLYSTRVVGRITDDRGYPVPFAQTNISPQAMNTDATAAGSDGNYTAYFSGSFDSLHPAAPGYGSFMPSVRSYYNTSMVLNSYLPPAQDVLLNGDFENSLENWQADEPEMARASVEGFSGSYGLELGVDCSDRVCLDEPQALPMTMMNSYDSLVAADGDLHLLWSRTSTINSWYTVTLSTQTDGGLWLDSEAIMNGYGVVYPDLAVDAGGGVHALIEQYNTSTGSRMLRYAYRSPGGVWSGVEELGSGTKADMVVDSTGKVVVIFATSYINYVVRTPGSGWGSSVLLSSTPSGSTPGLYLAPDDTVHFIYRYSRMIKTRSLTPLGELGAEEVIKDGVDGISNYHSIHRRPDGVLIATGEDTYGNYYYAERLAPNHWSLSIMPVPGLLNTSLEKDGIWYMAIGGSNRYIHLGTWTAQGGWGEWLPTVDSLANPGFDTQGDLVLVTGPYNGQIYWSKRAEQAVVGSVSQVVTIPAGSLHPTLAWQQIKAGLDVENTTFEVAVQEDAQPEAVVYTSTVGNAWEQAWVDLSAWVDKPVTIAFRLNQAAGDHLVDVSLDSVSLGDWDTPLVERVEPQVVPPGSSLQVTITGLNFREGAQVSVGGLPAASVQRLDERTLIITLPESLLPGVQEVRVTNLSGAFGLGYVLTGQPVFIPVTMK